MLPLLPLLLAPSALVATVIDANAAQATTGATVNNAVIVAPAAPLRLLLQLLPMLPLCGPMLVPGVSSLDDKSS